MGATSLLLLSPSLFLLRAREVGALKGGLVDPSLVTPVLLLNALSLAAIFGVARRAWLGGLFLLPLLLWLPAEWFYLWKFGGPTTAQSFGVLAETDPAEAMSWLGCTGTAVLAMCGVWLGALGFGISRLRRSGLAWRHWTAPLFGLLMPLLIAGAVVWSNASLAKEEIDFSGGDAGWLGVLDENRAGWTETLAMSYPLGMVVRLHDYWQQTRLLADVSRRAVREPFGARQSLASAQRQVFVFVVGESLRADHLELNGYGRQTTPRLARRDVISFKDYVSVSSSTRVSVPTYFTRQYADRLELEPGQPSLLDGLHEAGFRTYWLSTQAPFGRFDSPVAVVAQRADDVRFVNPGDYRQRGLYDAQLLEPLAQVLARKEKRTFIVLHTLGAHADYRYRYPEEAAHFVPVLGAGRMSDPWDPRQRKYQVNAYDNAVLYMDSFLDELIAQLEAEDAQTWLFYASDHGETLFDGQCRQAGHGFPSAANHRAAVLFWSSKAYGASHGAALERLRSHAELSSDYRAIMPTLLDLAGVSSARIAAGESLASVDYRPPEVRRVRPGGAMGVIDFDRQMGGVDCANGH